MYVNVKEEKVDVDLILRVIEEAKKISQSGISATWVKQKELSDIGSTIGSYILKVYKQSELYDVSEKWLDLLFSTTDVFKILKESKKIIRLTEYFDPIYGNIQYSYLYTKRIVRTRHAGVGGEDFFYLSEEDVKRYGIPKDYIYPLLPSSDYLQFFTFGKDDWEKIRRKGRECYIFIAHKPLNQLPDKVREYIKKNTPP